MVKQLFDVGVYVKVPPADTGFMTVCAVVPKQQNNLQIIDKFGIVKVA